MKKLIGSLSILLVLLCFACNKDKLPVSSNNLNAYAMLDKHQQKELSEQLGNYQVTCRLLTKDLILDPTGTFPIEIAIDSSFMDTLILNITNDRIYGLFVAQHINENTIFIETELLQNNAVSHFFLDDKSNAINYIDSSDPYMCKCDNNLSIKNDSIFYHYFREYSYPLTVRDEEKNNLPA